MVWLMVLNISETIPVQGYHWSDGTPVSHTNWGHNEPNNHGGRENCVEMVTTENGTSWWNDLNCDAHQDWICMIAKGKKPIIPPEPPSPVPGDCRKGHVFKTVQSHLNTLDIALFKTCLRCKNIKKQILLNKMLCLYFVDLVVCFLTYFFSS